MSKVLTHEEWICERAKRVTATDISAIVGLNPWQSKLSIWLQKTGRAEPITETLPMKLGKMLQPIVLDLYDSETGLSTRRCGDTELIVCPDFPLAAATPDAEVPGNRIVEAKTASGRGAMKFGEPGTDNAVPDYYAIQVYWQCLVMGQDSADLAALLSGRDFRIYEVVRGRNTGLEDMLKEAAERFWRDYVIPDKAPPVDASEEAAQWLARQFPHNTKQLLPASDEAERIAAEYLVASAGLEEYKIQKELAENRLKQIIRDNEGIEFSNGQKARWSRTKDSTKTNWELVAAHVSKMISKVDYESIVEKYTKSVDGIRKFYGPKKTSSRY